MPALPAAVSNVSRALKGSVFSCVAMSSRPWKSRYVWRIAPARRKGVNCTGENTAEKRCAFNEWHAQRLCDGRGEPREKIRRTTPFEDSGRATHPIDEPSCSCVVLLGESRV